MSILIILLFVLIAIIIAARYHVPPFFSLLGAAIITALLLGYTTDETIGKIIEGFGNTLGGIGIIIALGAAIGILLEKSGATQVMAEAILKLTGLGRSALALNLTGFIVSIPVFCDSGFILLSPLNKALSKRTGLSIVIYAVALASGLYAAHVFVPPTPGPLAAAAVLEANLGLLMVCGILIAVPVALSGYLWAGFIGKRVEVQSKQQVSNKVEENKRKNVWLSFAPVIVPIFLIGIKSIAEYPSSPLADSGIYNIILFIGQPIIALLIGFLISLLLVINQPAKEKTAWISKALKDAGGIILITGAGGAFGNIIRDSGITELFNGQNLTLSGPILIFFIGALLKTAQGSSTVAIITTAAIIAPLLGVMGLDSEYGRVLAVLAVGAGAMTVSHVNDSYFWVVAEFTNMDMRTALKTQTMATLVQGICALILILILKTILI